MRNNVMTIIKKEFSRFFMDRRLVFTTLIMPGLLIFIIYTLVGNAILASQTVPGGNGNAVFSIFTVNLPASIENASKDSDVYIGVETNDPESVKQSILSKETDLLIIFPADFDSNVKKYDPLSGMPAPNIGIYFNSASKTSVAAYETVTDLLNSYKYGISNKFDINRGDQIWDLTPMKSEAGSAMAAIIPMLLLIFMFSGCMTVAPESIAGEKERGTIATLLVTPIRKSELAAGKILSLGVMALLCGLSSSLGILLAFRNILAKAGVVFGANIYGGIDFLLLLFIVFSTVLLNVTLVSIMSAFATSVKEASTISIPLMFVNMLIGVSAIVSNGAQTGFYYYLIPLFNSVQCMQGIFASEYVVANILITLFVNIAFSCIGCVILSKMFASERVIFNK